MDCRKAAAQWEQGLVLVKVEAEPAWTQSCASSSGVDGVSIGVDAPRSGVGCGAKTGVGTEASARPAIGLKVPPGS